MLAFSLELRRKNGVVETASKRRNKLLVVCKFVSHVVQNGVGHLVPERIATLPCCQQVITRMGRDVDLFLNKVDTPKTSRQRLRLVDLVHRLTDFYCFW